MSDTTAHRDAPISQILWRVPGNPGLPPSYPMPGAAQNDPDLPGSQSAPTPGRRPRRRGKCDFAAESGLELPSKETSIPEPDCREHVSKHARIKAACDDFRAGLASPFAGRANQESPKLTAEMHEAFSADAHGAAFGSLRETMTGTEEGEPCSWALEAPCPRRPPPP